MLRTVEDADESRAVLECRTRRVVVVGGGLIGAEVAATGVARGHHTTMVDPSDLPTARAVGRLVAEHLQRLHRAAGVHVRSRTRVRGLDVRAGAVTGVVLEDGSRLPADVVMMATGTTPNVEWLQGSDLTVSGGLGCGAHPAHVRHHGARIRAVGFPHVADRSRVLWGSVETGRALVALGRGRQLVAVVSLDAHERLTSWVGQLRPGKSLDDLRAMPDVLTSGPPCARQRGPAVADR